MTRIHLLLFGAMNVALVSNAYGQATTADGAAALARGDYQRAVEILKPIAEHWRSTDRAAQFLMAGLYEAGRGVPVDPLRACALYMKASIDYDNPFGRLASSLAAVSIGRGAEFNEECQTLANVGFDNGFEPVTFDLGPGHYVQWTLAAATVHYQGQTKREPMVLLPGARFLPLQYTELGTGPTRSLTRHFVEVFAWQPSMKGGPSWELLWQVFEVVRDQIIRIDSISQPLAKLDGDAPPPRESFNVRDYAVLRVNDADNAEWAVLKGPSVATEGIESEAERREARDAELAREAALKKIDWSRRLDVARQPTMSYVDAEGCGDIHVYGWTADRAEVVTVRVNTAALGLSTQPATFDLSRESANISVKTYVYDAPRQRFDFCSDVVIRESGSVEPVQWSASAGTITIELSPPGARASRAIVTLSNVVLRNGAGTTVKVAGPIRLTAIVGGVFG